MQFEFSFKASVSPEILQAIKDLVLTVAAVFSS